MTPRLRHAPQATRADVRENKAEIDTVKVRIEKIKADLDLKMEKIKADLELKMEQLKTELQRDLGTVKADLQRDLGTVKADLLKWMVTALIAQTGVIVTVVLAV